MAGEQLFLVNEPRLIRDVLVTHNRNFTKSRGLERSKRLLGQGLTSEGAMHLRQRRLMQRPSTAIASPVTATLMVGYADRMRRGWTGRRALDISRDEPPHPVDCR
jgi:cytochrome P450